MQWRFATGGDVTSSVAVANGIVYAGSGDGRVLALDVSSGEKRWQFDAGSPVASSPAVAAGTVVFGTRDGRFFGLSSRTGKPLWSLSGGPDLPLPWGHESGDMYTASPAVAGNTAFFAAGDGQVYAVDLATGKRRWRARIGARVRSSPAVNADSVFVGASDGNLYCLERATGKQRWHFATEGAHLDSASFGYDRRTIQSSPAIAEGLVIFGSRDGSLYVLDATNGDQRWRVSHGTSWVITSPAIVDGRVYVGSSDAAFIQALDLKTGQQIWQQKIGTVIWSSLAVAGDAIYFGDQAGRLLAVDRQTGKPLWNFRTAGAVFSSPVISGDLVLFGSGDGGIYALRVGPETVDRAVFFDASLTKFSSVDSASLNAYLQHRGYTSVDLPGLVDFLTTHIRNHQPSVLVFAIDYAAPEIAASESSLLRQYLEAGGKVVWPGIPPLIWPRDAATGVPLSYKAIDWDATTRLLGVDHSRAIFDLRGVHATTDGTHWGLAGHWRGAWGVDPHAVSIVLAIDEFGLASEWVRNFGGAYGTGFVRVQGSDPLATFLVAEFRPAPVSSKRAAGWVKQICCPGSGLLPDSRSRSRNITSP